MRPAGTTPLRPLLVADRFPALGHRLVELLRGLQPEQWSLPTPCRDWSVHDIAAHLLDTALRRLSIERDRHQPPAPDQPITSYRDLVAQLDRWNASWVEATRRLSPAVLTELLAWVEPQLARHLQALDPFAAARFSVAWAGEESSHAWFDVARELTERWHHQQQIRLAVGAPPLADPALGGPVLETFLRALPHSYRETPAPGGTTVAVTIRGAVELAYVLWRDEARWELLGGEVEQPTAAVALDEQTAWLLLTKGMKPHDARERAQESGERRLLDPLFATVAVMG